MFRRVTVLLLLPVLAVGILAAQQIKKVPITQTPISGEKMFAEYCAACHGKSGQGDGPAADALKKKPADLTRLSARNGGKFPDLKVTRYIEGADEVAAHGNRDMPIWGNLFQSLNPTDNDMVRMRVYDLQEYLKSIQVK
jgi:mono/diheme cytochrome c family protein